MKEEVGVPGFVWVATSLIFISGVAVGFILGSFF